jgi:hypothetical protein
MPNISRKQIEAPEKFIMCTPKSDDANKALVMLQGPLDQPEPEYLQFLSDVMTAAGLVSHGKQCKALGERLSASSSKYRIAMHPAPFTPITADMVTKEMLIDIFPKSYSSLDKDITVRKKVKSDIANIYNAVGKYMGAKK